MSSIGTALSELASIGLLLACVVLWMRRRTQWLMVALGGSVVSILCRLVFMLAPSMYTGSQALQLIWPLASCVFALGLLAHAWFETPQNKGEGT